MPLEKLLEMRTAVDAEIMARSGGAAPGAAKKAKKAKRVSQGSAWADFTQMIVKEKADEYTAFKEASESKLGVAPRFVAAYRKAHEAEWEAFQTTWNAEHPKAEKGSKLAEEVEESASADEGSVASGASEKAASGKRRGPKKLADMTPEERAAHDAAVQKRREAKKAPAAAEEQEAKAAAPVVVVAAPAPAPVPVVAAPKPLPLKAAPAPAPKPAPVAVEEAEEEGVEQRTFTLDGQKYIRLWDSGANDWATGDLWAVKANGERDYYCGELMEDGSINTDAEEPELD